jgi:uncharacterized protein
MIRAALIVIGVAAGVYIVVVVGLYLLQERLLFFPERLEADYGYSFPHHFEEVSWQRDGVTINALLFRADTPHGVVLYFHGNAGSLRGWGAIAADFLERGYDVLLPEYRSYGKSTGRILSEQMLHDDAADAYRYLLNHYPEEEIIIYGRSLGTGIAVRLAVERNPRMLILETPYVSMRELARRHFPLVPGWLLRYPMRNDLWIADVTAPIYIFHGTEDELIPFASSERLRQLINTEHELIAIKGGGHNNLAIFPEYHRALERICAETR